MPIAPNVVEPTVSDVRMRRAAAAAPGVPPYLGEDPRDRRRLRVAVLAALACHLPLLLLPRLGGETTAAVLAEPSVVALQRTPRFRPPEPPPTRPEPEPVREEPAVVVPIPDPTPAEAEPVRELELPAPVDRLPEILVSVPVAPPEPAAGPAEILRVGGEIARPRQLFAPHPVYTEVARRARLEGTVILEVLLDERGRVEEVTVLRGQRLGLTDTAIAAVSRWRYEPARRQGRAVPVLMTVTIHFELS